MEIFKKVSEVKTYVSALKQKGKNIGFVPTMGALHDGHMSLLKYSKDKTDFSIVSIFVNPTQFNNKQDFIKYPRNFEKDIDLLRTHGCDAVFIPSDEEMYPEPDKRVFDLGYLENIMEGEFRPGHFQGVAQIVSKLFDAVPSDYAFFGQKDFQQLAIIKRLVQMLNFPVNIIGCPIVREKNGLAMSSRNQRLTLEEFNSASIIYQTISKIPDIIRNLTIDEIKNFVKKSIDTDTLFKTEYVEIVDSESLNNVKAIENHTSVTCCVAVFCDQVRLIDNIQINL